MKIDWHGLIAAILAFGLTLTLIIGVLGATWSGRPLGEKGGEVLVGIFVAMGAAITAYMVRSRNGGEK